MDVLEGIMLNEINQTKINTEKSHLYLESKKSQAHRNSGFLWCVCCGGSQCGNCQGLRFGGNREMLIKYTTSSCKMSKFWGI